MIRLVTRFLLPFAAIASASAQQADSAIVSSRNGMVVSTIINTVTEIVLNATTFGTNVREAVDAPRFHHQWLPDEVTSSAMRFPIRRCSG